MKTFLMRSLWLFSTALAVTIGVYTAIWLYRTNPELIIEAQQQFNSLTGIGDATSSSTESTASIDVPKEGIPLSSVSLKSEQKAVLEKIGIDTDSFVITKAMVGCAEGKVGAARVAEIMKGASPSSLEIAKLSPCLKAS